MEPNGAGNGDENEAQQGESEPEAPIGVDGLEGGSESAPNPAELEAFREWKSRQEVVTDGDGQVSTTADESPQSTAARAASSRRSRLRVWIPVALGLAVTVLVAAYMSINSKPSLEAVAENCESSLTYKDWMDLAGFSDLVADRFTDEEMEAQFGETLPIIDVANDGTSLSVDGSYYPQLDTADAFDLPEGGSRDQYLEKADALNLARDLAVMAAIACVHEELGMPDALWDRMSNTRGLDGTLEDEYAGVRVRWSYHPDSGLSAIYEPR